MQTANAYRLGLSISDVRDAARCLHQRMLAHGRASAWFALGYWHCPEPGQRQVVETYAAIQELMADLAYDGLRQRADEVWTEWLLYAPVAELRRRSA